MLKIDNLSNEIDMTAVHGGDSQTNQAAVGGVTATGYAGGWLSPQIIAVSNQPTVLQSNEMNKTSYDTGVALGFGNFVLA
jgi:hypothetical protein